MPRRRAPVTPAETLEAWFRRAARPYPWREVAAGARDPYHCLVLEAMAQQTQLSRVLLRWPEFLARFPTIHALAAARPEHVLEAWRGMGYYRRARNLHAAARLVVDRFGGVVPRDVSDLLTLPGVGRYTAGAIASMAYNQRAPIVDGNVARVLLRIHGIETAADDRAVQPTLWRHAEKIVAAAPNPGVCNEALMELGATVCLAPPAAPKCETCPWQGSCQARELGFQSRIPRPKVRATSRILRCAVAVVLAPDGRTLLVRRPESGLWAGLWQPPTVESQEGESPPSRASVARALAIRPASLSPAGTFVFHTTHREVRFTVYRATLAAIPKPLTARSAVRRWVRPEATDVLAISNAHRRALSLGLSTPAPRTARDSRPRKATIAGSR